MERQRRLNMGWIAAFAVACLLVVAPTASAASLWSSPAPVDPAFHASSVSCTTSFCVAVDGAGNAITYNGTTWSSPSNIDGTNQLSSVSCSSATFCAAVDFQGNAVTYDGSKWTAWSSIDSNGPASVSCPSGSFCAAVDNAGDVITFNGKNWTAATNIDSHQLTSISCHSSSFCVAIDNAGKVTRYDGTKWTPPATIDGTNILESVSCPTATFCAALDGAGNAFTYDGTSWSAAPATHLMGGSALACTSSSFCAAVDPNGGAVTYDGSTWTARSQTDRVGQFMSVACTSPSFCAAVDNAGRVVTYNGSAWAQTAAIGGGGILSVSCPSEAFCAAVDRNGRTLTYNGTNWTTPARIDGTTEMRSVSCTSSSFCVAIDDNGNALFFNGSVWSSPQTTEFPPDQLEAVMCRSSSFCAAVDGGSHAVTYGGGSWTTTTDNLTGGSAVSCTSSTFCVAGDFTGGAATFNGTAWTARASVSSRAIVSLACFSASSCIAADSGGNTSTFDGTTWTAPAPVDAHGFTSMSCPASSFCGAVDAFGFAMTYNGSTWTAEGSVDAFGDRLQSVSCVASGFCAAVDDSGNALTRASGSSTPPPSNKTPPTAAGTTRQGQFLTATGDQWTNSPTSFGYQWERCDESGANCSDIKNATGKTYQLVAGDVKHTIRVRETATNDGGTSAAVTSAATAVVAVTDFTWTGAARNQDWSDASNWTGAGGTPLGAYAGTLSFPASACGSSGCSAIDDIAGVTASALDLVAPSGSTPQPSWSIGGSNPLTLTGGLSSTVASLAAGNFFGTTALHLPIVLGGDNTWTIGGQTELSGGLSGAHSLTIDDSSVLTLDGASDEVGPVTVNRTPGGIAPDGVIALGSGSAPGDLDGSDGNQVTLHGATLFGTGTTGPLSLGGATLQPGFGSGGTLSVHGPLTFDASSHASFNHLNPGSAGTDYPQVAATGAATVAGSLLLTAACSQPAGTTYTLLRASGGVNGTFNSNDGIVPASCTGAGGGAQPSFQIGYPGDAVTARVVFPPAVTTGGASAITETTATLNGSVNPNGLGVSDCHFDYGTTLAYGSTVGCAQSVGSGTAPAAVSAQLPPLAPGTTYYYRLSATNAAGTGAGQSGSFTTLAPPPPPSAPRVPCQPGSVREGTSQVCTPVAPGGTDADCYEMNYSGAISGVPSLDATGTADACLSATTQLGFNARAHTGAAGDDALRRAQTDAIFAFSGHSGCTLDPPVGGFLWFSTGPPDALSSMWLVGGPGANACLNGFSLPVAGTLYNLPTELSAARLVVLQACVTGLDTSDAQSLGRQIFNAGAKNVIGFNQDVFFGPNNAADPAYPIGRAWARGFWSGLATQGSVDEALQNAVDQEFQVDPSLDDHGYSWGDIVALGRQPIPTVKRLAAGGIAARRAAPAGLAGGRSPRLTRVLARFLHRRLRRTLRWTTQRGPGGTEYSARLGGVGLFTIDRSRRRVVIAVFDPPRRRGARAVSLARARRLATTFAVRHSGQRLRGWVLRVNGGRGGPDGQLDFKWQARKSGVWLPSRLQVSVRSDGSIASYALTATAVRASLKPRVSAGSAASIARAFAHAAPGTAPRSRELLLWAQPSGAQRLTWLVRLPPAPAPALSGGTIVAVDARTGSASLFAD